MIDAMGSDYPNRTVVKIISTACRHCRDCVEICPEDAMTWAQGQVVINEDRCTGCGRCVQVCRAKVLKTQSK